MSKCVDEARSLAQEVHKGQIDKLGVDYMKHVETVTASVAHLGEDYVITALLHDTVEDCEDADLVNLALISDRFGQKISDAVDSMTKRDGEEYTSYLDRVLSNQIARAVKHADIAHNQSRLALLTDPVMRSRLQTKYARALDVIAK